ncbi:MAG: cupin domain-containing protein [Haloarculaceae archaeon]
MDSKAPADGKTVEAVEGAHLTALVVGDRMSVQHFHIEPGARIPAHSHEQEQVGMVTKGTLTFESDGETEVISPGESYLVPGGADHAATNESEVPVDGIDVFAPPRSNPDWMED